MSYIRIIILAMVAMTLLSVSALDASAEVIYSNDFTLGAGSGWSNSSTAFRNGEYFLGATEQGFGNGSDVLSLSTMPAHTQVTVSFDLYIIQSWDGNGAWGGGPDNWQLKADGKNLLYTNFANYANGNTQAYSSQLAPYGSGGSNDPMSGAFTTNHLGYGTGDWGDTTYRFSFTFDHTASTLDLAFISYQGQLPGDEGWGLDNVSVVTSVPEPSTGLLLGIGGIALYAFSRRKYEWVV